MEEDTKCNKWKGGDGRRITRQNGEQLNLISSNLWWIDASNGPIFSAWSPVIPEVTQLPDAKIVIFDLTLDGARQELARRRRDLR